VSGRGTSRRGWAGVAGVVLLLAAHAHAQPLNGPVLPPEQAAESRPLGSGPAKPRPVAPAPPSTGQGRAWMAQTGLSLAAVLALALGAGWILRAVARRNGGLRSALSAGGRAPAGILEILGRYPVSRGATLVLLKLDRRILLLSQTAGGRFGGGGFATLAEISDPEEVASILVKSRDADGDSLAERFHSMLSRHDRAMGEPQEPPTTAPPSGRRLQSSAAGDSAEVWDTARGSIPVVDLTRQPGPGEHAGAVGSLRRRLATLRKMTEGAA